MQWPLPAQPTRQDTPLRDSSGLLFGWGVTASATPHTKGAWTVMQTAPASGGTGILFWHYGNHIANVDTSALLDIGVRIGGNDYVVIPDMVSGFLDAHRVAQYIPMYIPAGSQIIMRMSSAVGSLLLPAGCDIIGGEPASSLSTASKFTSYGTTLAASSGTTITPNAAVNTKGSWAELTASTSHAIHEMIISLQGNSDNMTIGDAYTIDIGVGGSGSERVVYSNYTFRSYAVFALEAVYYNMPRYLPISFDIPAGSRLVARCAGQYANSDALEIGVTGLTY